MERDPIRHSCGSLRAADVGQFAELNGWVNRRRDHGGLLFIDVRDRDGVTQTLFDPQHEATFALAESLRAEDVVRVRGTVRLRPPGTLNQKLPTGEVEVAAGELEILNRSKTPPFPIATDEDVDENLRLEYRYLDLRRPRLQYNLTMRHKIVKAIRDYFDAHGFLEIETPMLIKSTPEGARDYLVPSRVNPGKFYALPQSPQLLKQILMIAGFGRYMQIARCFRDEDLRADRQPEFTQLDVELSFPTQEMVIEYMEGSMVAAWREALGIELPQPFPRMEHVDALRHYGSDKPDLRFGLELVDVAEHFADSEFEVFRAMVHDPNRRIVAVRYPGGAALSRREFDALADFAKTFGAQGLVWIALARGGVRSSIGRFLTEGLVQRLRTALEAQEDDAILIVADERELASAVGGRLRLEVGERLGLRDPAKFAFTWVLDFPLFEHDPETGGLAPAHHPFTAPLPGQEELVKTDPLAARAQHYDLVLNGWELGSGSIRIHRPELQRLVFETIGLSPQEIDERFGFFVRALDYGAPPHGGMALGIDRIVMIACGDTTIRDVIAFPKNQGARDVMMDAPASVPAKALRELGLSVRSG